MAIAPHQPSRGQESLGTSYASPLVLAKGEATGFGGSDRQRIRGASSHPGPIGGATSRVQVQIGAVDRVAKRQQLPVPAQPAYAIGQVSIARRTLDARKRTTELCRHFVRVFALSEGQRGNTRHNPEVGIMATSGFMLRGGESPGQKRSANLPRHHGLATATPS